MLDVEVPDSRLGAIQAPEALNESHPLALHHGQMPCLIPA